MGPELKREESRDRVLHEDTIKGVKKFIGKNHVVPQTDREIEKQTDRDRY